MDEASISRVAWSTIHDIKAQRKNILELILPAHLYARFVEEQENVRNYVFYQLSNRINDIIQDNLFFLIENNIGKVAVIEDLFDQVANQLIKYHLVDRVDDLTVRKCDKNRYFEMLRLEQTGYGIVKSAQSSWLYLTFCLWLKRVIVVSPHHISKIVPMLQQAYPFFVFVLKDSVVLEHRKHVELVRVSSK